MKTPRSHLSYATVSESGNPGCTVPTFHTACAWEEFRTSRTLAVRRVLCYDYHSTGRGRRTTIPAAMRAADTTVFERKRC